MLLYSYTIPLDPRTKKNHQQICGSGKRCPACGKPARQYVRQSSASTQFAFNAARFLAPRPQKPIDYPVHCVIRFYMQTRRRVDQTNLEQNIYDIMTSNGILSDDNIRIIRCKDGSGVWYSKDHPRVEIEIHDMEGVEDYALNE